MTDYKSVKPVLMLPPKVYLDADDGGFGPVIDTLGYRKLHLVMLNGECEGNYQRHYLQSSANGSSFTDVDASALLLSSGLDAPGPGAKQSVVQGWVDLTPELRYLRIRIDRTTNSVGATDEHPVGILGYFMDPVDTQYAGTAMYHDGSSATAGNTEDPAFKLDAHNRA